MKVLNRGLKINVPASEVALMINGLNVFGVNNALYAGNTAKTAQNQVRGRLKLDVRPTGGTTEDYAFQIRSESGKTSGTHLGIDNETHLKATGTATIMSTRGVAVIDTGYTATGVSLIGVYGQARADGTLAGSGSMMAGLYGLIEASAAITASHVCSAWLDSHQANAVTGEHELLYMTNNGAATMDQAIFIYPGNKITNLFTIDPTDEGLVDDATGQTLTPIKKINVKIDGTTYVIVAGTCA
jgi:hypothetical protein